jgi:hypothetical protein
MRTSLVYLSTSHDQELLVRRMRSPPASSSDQKPVIRSELYGPCARYAADRDRVLPRISRWASLSNVFGMSTPFISGSPLDSQ